MPDSHDLLKLSPALMAVNTRPRQVFVRGQGSWLWDAEGRPYMDWLQGWAVNCLGHCPPVVAQALQEQSQWLITPSPALHNAPALELAALLRDLSGFDQVFFGSTGAEANEAAIKLARKWGRLHRGGASEIISFEGAFHGRSLATMAASGKPGWDALFPPAVPGFRKAVLNDLDSVQALVNERTAAVMVEPVQGEAGVWPASAGFLQGLRQLCDRHGLLLIFDEVQTGCGRLGELFGFQLHGVRPDIMTLGKGLGAGVPLSAVLARQHASVFDVGDHGGTHTGHPLMCAVGLAVLRQISQPHFLAGVRARAADLAKGLGFLAAEFGLGPVRGQGMLWALEIGGGQAAEVVRCCHALGLLVNAPRPNSLRLMPALNLTPGELAQGLTLLRDGLAGVLPRSQTGAARAAVGS